MSLPSRERGLKHAAKAVAKRVDVAPLAGAWIETVELGKVAERKQVAPLAGAWIETDDRADIAHDHASLPSRERGLKQDLPAFEPKTYVAPLAGAWIETSATGFGNARRSRSPRGSVD